MSKHPDSGSYNVETPANLIRAAVEVFARSGYDGASTHEIARRAGAKQSQISYHFGGKEQLWRATIEAVNADFNTELSSVLGSARRRDHLRTIVEAYLRFSWRQPQWPILLVQEGMNGDERATWLFDTVVHPIMARVYSEMTGRPIPTKDDPDRLRALSTFSVLGSGALVFISKLQNRRLFAIDTEMDAFFRVHVETIYVAMKAILAEERRQRRNHDHGDVTLKQPRRAAE